MIRQQLVSFQKWVNEEDRAKQRCGPMVELDRVWVTIGRSKEVIQNYMTFYNADMAVLLGKFRKV